MRKTVQHGPCPVTGDSICTCGQKKYIKTKVGRAMLLDMKSALRKIFTDHAVYTNWLILESLPIKNNSDKFLNSVVTRLLQNPSDIANLIQPIVGTTVASKVEKLFTEHLKLAAATLEPARNEMLKDLDTAIKLFYANGEEIGTLLGQINSYKLSGEDGRKLMQGHNEYVVKLVSKRKDLDDTYTVTYDEYYKHMLMFSDILYETFTL